jgi:hypothetical protein
MLLKAAADVHSDSARFHGDCCKALDEVDRGGGGDIRTGDLDGPKKAMSSALPSGVRVIPPSDNPGHVTAVTRPGQAPIQARGAGGEGPFEKLFGSLVEAD